MVGDVQVILDQTKMKQSEFNAAMKLYERSPVYIYFNRFISISNIGLQFLMLLFVADLSVSWQVHLLSFLMAYLLCDFVNGLVHMYMDSNDHYNWLGGPLVAYFHLHHKRPIYKKNPLPLVYFNETGYKVWLVPFLIASLILTRAQLVSPWVSALLMYFCFLSSIAEVSHYICHTINSRWAIFLGKLRILLPIGHHGKHHASDNMNYAFLNGVTDTVLNIIARKFFQGYKNNTDLHYATYEMPEINSRR